MKIRAIITGCTGMVGEGVLKEALSHPDVEKVLVINRKVCGIIHPKLTEIIHKDFYDLSPVAEQMRGYNACFFCLGISSLGLKKEEYFSLTYTLTMHMADTLALMNNDMVFCYVSGAGTDSSEKGRVNWARVKGKTENDLMKLPFKKVYVFRPAYLHPSDDLKNIHGFHALYKVLYPVLRIVAPNYLLTLEELGLAMINGVKLGYHKQILEVKDIYKLAHKRICFKTDNEE